MALKRGAKIGIGIGISAIVLGAITYIVIRFVKKGKNGSASATEFILMGDRVLTWDDLYVLGSKYGLSKVQVQTIVAKGRATFDSTVGVKYPNWYDMIEEETAKYGISLSPLSGEVAEHNKVTDSGEVTTTDKCAGLKGSKLKKCRGEKTAGGKFFEQFLEIFQSTAKNPEIQKMIVEETTKKSADGKDFYCDGNCKKCLLNAEGDSEYFYCHGICSICKKKPTKTVITKTEVEEELGI